MRALARARVLLACRDAAKCDAAARDVRAAAGLRLDDSSDAVQTVRLDLGDLRAVLGCAAALATPAGAVGGTASRAAVALRGHGWREPGTPLRGEPGTPLWGPHGAADRAQLEGSVFVGRRRLVRRRPQPATRGGTMPIFGGERLRLSLH